MPQFGKLRRGKKGSNWEVPVLGIISVWKWKKTKEVRSAIKSAKMINASR